MKQSKYKFYVGFILGLVLMSVITNAGVVLSKFTAGSPISSAEVNQNFDKLREKVEGFSASLSANYTHTCDVNTPDYSTAPGMYYTVDLHPESSDPSVVNAGHEYVVPATGFYHIVADYGLTANYVNSSSVIIKNSAGALVENVSGQGTHTFYRKLIAGTRVSFVFSCYNNYMYGNVASVTLDSSKIFFMIKNM